MKFVVMMGHYEQAPKAVCSDWTTAMEVAREEAAKAAEWFGSGEVPQVQGWPAEGRTFAVGRYTSIALVAEIERRRP